MRSVDDMKSEFDGKTFTAVFYAERAEEHRITEKARSKAEFTRLAKETARLNNWRLVEIYEDKEKS